MEPTGINHAIEEQRRYELLQWAGWSATGIQRLMFFRLRYKQTSLDLPTLDLHHLEFARWLVRSGKLGEW